MVFTWRRSSASVGDSAGRIKGSGSYENPEPTAIRMPTAAALHLPRVQAFVRPQTTVDRVGFPSVSSGDSTRLRASGGLGMRTVQRVGNGVGGDGRSRERQPAF